MSTACQPLSDLDISTMQKALDRTVPGPKQRDGSFAREYVSQLTAVDFACVDQDVIVMYDPSALKDQPGRSPTQRPPHIPRFDFSGDPYYFRQASQLSAYDKLKSLGNGADLPSRESLTSTVLGYAFGREPHNELVARMASPEEVSALSQPFSTCTTPLIYQSLWMHNLNEWISRGPVSFHKYQVARPVLPANLSIVLHSPLKIPVPQWNIEVLRPFSTLAPSALADFSSRLPSSTPSASTHEGTHVRCFRKLLVWRDIREERPYTAAHIGPMLLDYHAPTLRHLDATERPFWRSRAKAHMRVLIERRNTYGKTGTRQFLHLDVASLDVVLQHRKLLGVLGNLLHLGQDLGKLLAHGLVLLADLRGEVCEHQLLQFRGLFSQDALGISIQHPVHSQDQFGGKACLDLVGSRREAHDLAL